MVKNGSKLYCHGHSKEDILHTEAPVILFYQKYCAALRHVQVSAKEKGRTRQAGTRSQTWLLQTDVN